MLINVNVSSVFLAGSLAVSKGLAFQSPADSGDAHLTMIFVGIAAISLLILVLVVVGTLLALLIVGWKAMAAGAKTVTELKGKVSPIIDKANGLIGTLAPAIKSITEQTNTLIGALSPKIGAITDNVHGITSQVEQMSTFVKDRLHEFSPTIAAANETLKNANETVRDANRKTREQINRVNEIVSNVLEIATAIVETLHRGILAPARRLAGLVSGAKARWTRC